MKDIKPTPRLKHQPLTSSPQAGYPEAIMDDPVYTMDDNRILMGGQVSTASNIKGNTRIVKPRGIIKKHR